MHKFAQTKRQTGRGWANELREKINIPNSYIDGFFKPELDRVMNSLKALDDRIRSELTGKKIGTAEIPTIAKSAKDILKEARTNFNRREYMMGVADLGMFHKKMQDIVNDITRFKIDVSKIHHKFLFEGVNDEKIKQLRQHMEKKNAQTLSEQLIKEAGIMDFFYNIGTKRGRSLAAYEKKYPKQTKEIREGGLRLLDAADNLLNKTISIFKEMATARAIRRPDDYMDAANKIKFEFDKFDGGDKGFRSYYITAIDPMIKMKDSIEEESRKTQQSTTPDISAKQMELGGPGSFSPPGVNIPTSQLGTPSTNVPPMGSGFVTNPLEKWLNPPTSTTTPPTTSDTTQSKPPIAFPPELDIQEESLQNKYSHFYKSLQSMSNEDPRILGFYIAKYAKSIQKDDPETAIKLFSIVRRLKG